FVRTRENGAEFGSSASAGKLMRDALRPLIMRAADGRVTSRLTKVMTLIKNLDATSVRGERNVGVAIALPAAKEMLKVEAQRGIRQLTETVGDLCSMHKGLAQVFEIRRINYFQACEMLGT